jgi:hypothetical protein
MHPISRCIVVIDKFLAPAGIATPPILFTGLLAASPFQGPQSLLNHMQTPKPLGGGYAKGPAVFTEVDN